MKKVIVTGATSFIGRWVIRELISHGVEVIAIIRENSPKRSALDGMNVRVVECSLANYKNLPKLINDSDIDVVYHFAWQGVNDHGVKDADIQLENVKATLEILDAMDTLQIKSFIGAGSLHEAEAIQEIAEGKVITNLRFMYKVAKTCAHWMSKVKAGSEGIRFLWPLISNAYGEGEDSGRLIDMVIRKIFAGETPPLSDGTQNYDFVHVSDVARAFFLIGEKGIDGAKYVIGSGEAKPLREFLNQIGAIANAMKGGEIVPLGFGEFQTYVAYLPVEAYSIENLTNDTGYKAEISFADGVARTAGWIRRTG